MAIEQQMAADASAAAIKKRCEGLEAKLSEVQTLLKDTIGREVKLQEALELKSVELTDQKVAVAAAVERAQASSAAAEMAAKEYDTQLTEALGCQKEAVEKSNEWQRKFKEANLKMEQQRQQVEEACAEAEKAGVELRRMQKKLEAVEAGVVRYALSQ